MLTEAGYILSCFLNNSEMNFLQNQKFLLKILVLSLTVDSWYLHTIILDDISYRLLLYIWLF